MGLESRRAEAGVNPKGSGQKYRFKGMNSLVRACLLVALIAALLSASTAREAAAGAYGNRGIVFEPNQSAVGGMTWFPAHGFGRNLSFGASGTVSESDLGVGASGPRLEMAMRLVGARGGVAPRAVGPQTGSANYLVGSPERWRLGVPLYEKIATLVSIPAST